MALAERLTIETEVEKEEQREVGNAAGVAWANEKGTLEEYKWLSAYRETAYGRLCFEGTEGWDWVESRTSGDDFNAVCTISNTMRPIVSLSLIARISVLLEQE